MTSEDKYKLDRIVRLRREAPELYYLATGLNNLRNGEPDPEHLWEYTERIILGIIKERSPRKGRSTFSNLRAGVGKPSLEEAQGRFHWLSKQYPVVLTIDLEPSRKGTVAVPSVRTHKSISDKGLTVGHLYILWKQFFEEGGYKRLRTCRHCGDWFVNLGRNQQGVFCSKRCSNGWWSRSQRRAARHSQYQ